MNVERGAVRRGVSSLLFDRGHSAERRRGSRERKPLMTSNELFQTVVD